MANQTKKVDIKKLQDVAKEKAENKEVVKPSGFRSILTLVK